MSYTLEQAARATGKTKPTIARDIQIGRLSATRGGDGSYVIDPAELHRVYPTTGNANGQTQRFDTPVDGVRTPAASPAEVEGLRALLAERERRVEEQASAIRDLRVRLDDSETERRRVQERLTGLLTHRRAGSVPPVKPNLSPPDTSYGTRVPWWRRWFR